MTPGVNTRIDDIGVDFGVQVWLNFILALINIKELEIDLGEENFCVQVWLKFIGFD